MSNNEQYEFHFKTLTNCNAEELDLRAASYTDAMRNGRALNPNDGSFVGTGWELFQVTASAAGITGEIPYGSYNPEPPMVAQYMVMLTFRRPVDE